MYKIHSINEMYDVSHDLETSSNLCFYNLSVLGLSGLKNVFCCNLIYLNPISKMFLIYSRHSKSCDLLGFTGVTIDIPVLRKQ